LFLLLKLILHSFFTILLWFNLFRGKYFFFLLKLNKLKELYEICNYCDSFPSCLD
jgi:hypothetical protein